MQDLLTRFHAYLLTEKRVAHNTFDAYKRDLDQFANYLKTLKKNVETAHEQDIKLFLHFLKKSNCTARSVARKISALKLFFSWAHAKAALVDITKQIHAPKMQKKLPIFLTEREIEQLFAAVHKDTSQHAHRNQIMLYLLYASGMRISELVHTKISDIHFDQGFISVKGKAGRGRLVPLPEQMLTLLKEYMQKTGALISNKQAADAFLFAITYGKKVKPISRQSLWLILKKICNNAGIAKSVSPHTLRHSLATHLLKKGAHLRALQLLLGHEQLATVQIYTHVETSYVRTIYDKKHPRA